MAGLITQSLGFNLRVMRFFGLYSKDCDNRLYKAYGFFLYFVFLIPVPVLGCLYLLLTEDLDLVRVADNAFMLAEVACFIIKYPPFLIQGVRIRKCIQYFERRHVDSATKHQKQIQKNCIKTCRRNTRIFLVIVAAGWATWVLKPLFLTTRRLPLDIWLPFSPESDHTVYIITYSYLGICIAYAAFSSGVIDTLIAGLACQATGQLQILKDNLQNLSVGTENVYGNIKQCIQHHNEILNFVKQYEECFTLVVFSQFSGSVVVICTSCLQLIMMEPFSFNFFAMVSYLVTMLGQIYLYCYYGTSMIEESTTLTTAVYMSNWYQFDIKSKKSLAIMMERFKKPMIVTAGKILDLSLTTFTTILRRSYSLLAVLKNYN